MQIHYVLGSYPTLLEDMVAKVYEASAPSSEVDSILIPETDGAGVPTVGAGHPIPVNVTFTGLDRVPHILRLFTDSGTMLQEFNVQPVENIVTVFDPIYFKIGDGQPNTPLAGATSYVNTDLAGLTNADLDVYRNGGALFPTVHHSVDSSGGFSLLQSGDIFSDGEEFIVRRKQAVIPTYVNDSVVGKQWGPTTGNDDIFVDVTGTISYAATHLRKVIRISGSGAYHFDSAVPIGYPFRFSNQVGGSPTIYFDTNTLIKIGGNVASMIVPPGSIVEVVFDGANFNITQNTMAIPAEYASVVYMGAQAVGNVPGSGISQTFNVTIPNQFTSNYRVLGALKSVNPANATSDTNVFWTVTDKTFSSFSFTVREAANSTQDLIFEFVIVKLN